VPTVGWRSASYSSTVGWSWQICSWKVRKEAQAATIAAEAAFTQRASSLSTSSRTMRKSTVSDLSDLMEGSMFVSRRSIRASMASIASSVTSSSLTSISSLVTPCDHLEEVSWRFWVVEQLVVHGIPMFDAFVTRLPLTFLAIAITKSDGKLVACCIIFSYQSTRAVSQCIQTCYVGPTVCYALTSTALLGYLAMLIMLLTGLGADFWYIPISLTGLSETLPVQQYFLTQMFLGDSSGQVQDRSKTMSESLSSRATLAWALAQRSLSSPAQGSTRHLGCMGGRPWSRCCMSKAPDRGYRKHEPA